MTYGRYEGRRNWREPRERDEYRDERSQWRGDEDRGFFERAGDEIASWFGDDDAQRRRERDERHHDEYRRCPEAQRPLRDDPRITTYETSAKANEVERRKKGHILKAQGTADRKSLSFLCDHPIH